MADFSLFNDVVKADRDDEPPRPRVCVYVLILRPTRYSTCSQQVPRHDLGRHLLGPQRFGRRSARSASPSSEAAAILACAPPPGPLGCCPLGVCLNGWSGIGRPWGVRPSGVGAGGAVVHPGRSGPAGSLSRRKFELGATAPGAVREALFSILAAYSPSRRRRSV